MADQNKSDGAGNFFNEVLSPSELFAARSRSHKIPLRGQKEFLPNDSDEQRRRLEQSLSEHWSLLSEERVERLGNLVKATWIPGERRVELQSPAGKFWQTMGFSADGKQQLLPEEALYLMECGNLQVFHQELPLSIQDGYENFLSSSGSVSLQQYQVFGHLKRLGYVVHRFDPSSEPSSYTRQLNLPLSRDRAARQLKRKRSASPPAASSRVEAQEMSVADSVDADDDCGHDDEEAKKNPETHSTTSPETPETGASAEGSADPGVGRTWWRAEVPGGGSEQPPASAPSRWLLGSIPFPDLGSGGDASGCLLPPDPSLLPGSLAVGVCDVASWRKKINLRTVKMSEKERQREDDKHRHRRDVNRDREVRRCRNWAEYRELLARRQGRQRGRPAHLWDREVAPLHDPTQPISTAELLDKLSVVKSSHLLDGASGLMGCTDWRICFNVYQPDTVADFKKSSPGKPYARMCVCSFDSPVPDLRAIKQLAYQSGDVPVVFAVVDHGDISFYTFKDFQLPTDVFP